MPMINRSETIIQGIQTQEYISRLPGAAEDTKAKFSLSNLRQKTRMC